MSIRLMNEMHSYPSLGLPRLPPPPSLHTHVHTHTHTHTHTHNESERERERGRVHQSKVRLRAAIPPSEEDGPLLLPSAEERAAEDKEGPSEEEDWNGARAPLNRTLFEMGSCLEGVGSGFTEK